MRFTFLIILYCTWSCVVVKAASNDVCNLPDGNVTVLPGSCNFNNGHCGYDFPDNLWDTYTESFGSVIYGAITGDNTGSSQTFALFQSNDPSFNDTIITNSSILTTEVYYTNTPICLKFWYLMPNQNSKLYVYLIDSGTNISTVLFDHSYSSISQWKEVKIPLTVSSNFKVEFQSERENAYGYVGVDNVQFVIETPPATTTASTTTTTSTTITTTIATTEATTPTTAPQKTAPTTQSTTLSTTTPTSTTTTNTPRYTTRTTTMTTTTTPLETTTMSEPTTEIITTTERLTTEPTTTKMTTQLFTTRERTELPTTDCVCNCPTVSTICAESLNTLTTPSSVFTVCNLPSERLSVLNQYSCNFDHDMCGYILSSYPHLWEMTSHHYGNGNVGEIIGDHSKESLSGYMVFNTYNNHVQNNTSHNFRSPLLLPFTQYCASFWYNMPNNASVIEVHVEFQNSTRELLWQQKGTPTNGWVQAKIPLLEESSFSLIFSSTKMTSPSFVGVDDIRISIEKPNITMATGRKRRSLASILGSTSLDEDTPRCPCTCPPYHVINCKTTIRPIPPYEQSCSDLMNAVYVKEGSCDFDDGTSCSYNLPVYPHLWDLVQYQYGNQSTGIIDGDLSGGRNGVYLAFTTDDLHVPFGMTSNFRSGTLLEVGNLCLSFWYNLPTNSASLNVYKESGDKQELLWKMENQKSAGWQRATILFKADQNMKIDFVSSKTSLDAYFGLDEIQLYRNATM